MNNSLKNQSAEADELENSYRLPEIVRQRKQTLKKLSLKSGEHVLDIGCGVGFLSYEMAVKTGDSGKVIGIDKSPEMIRHAINRCKGLGNTEFMEGEAGSLPFPENNFDAVCCTQVLLYVKDVLQVLAEIRRVLKPAGRIVIVETDWRGVVLNSAFNSLTRKIFSAWDAAVPSPNLPVYLGPLLKKYGFSSIQVEPVPILNTEYSSNQFSHGMMKWITKNALKKGVITDTECRKWQDDLEEKEKTGSYFFCVNRFLFTAVLA